MSPMPSQSQTSVTGRESFCQRSSLVGFQTTVPQFSQMHTTNSHQLTTNIGNTSSALTSLLRPAKPAVRQGVKILMKAAAILQLRNCRVVQSQIWVDIVFQALCQECGGHQGEIHRVLPKVAYHPGRGGQAVKSGSS